MVFPWIAFLKERKRRLSDIEFLAIKEYGGKLVNDEGVKTTTGDLATLTANSGKDLYVARAKVSCTPSSVGIGASSGSATIELKVNGTVVETASYSWAARSTASNNFGSGQFAWDYEFKDIGHKVDATQVIKLEVSSISTANVEGFIEGFEEDDGNSPQV